MRTSDATTRGRFVPAPGGAVAVAAASLLLASAGIVSAATPDVTLGLGGYFSRLKSGDGPLPVAEFVTGEAAGKAAPTNQWYSSVMFQRWSQPIHAHPMTYRATEEGFEVGLPAKRFANVDGSLELSYAHEAAIVVAPVGFKPRDARLSKFSDWLAQVSMAAGPGETLTATVLHGSPFSFFESTTGDVRFRFASKPQVFSDPADAARDPRVVAVTIDGRSYAMFAPTGATWEWPQPTELVLRLPAAARYFSVAGLPDARDATLADFLAVAYAFPTDTRVEWTYDEAASKVRSVYRVQTVAKEGENLTTLMGLYSHHWSSVVSEHPSQHGYDTVRGRIRLVPGNSFTLERTYHGFVPVWPGLQDAASKDSVASLLVGDHAKAAQLFRRPELAAQGMGRGTYYVGKGLGAAAQLLSVAEAEGKTKVRDDILAQLKDRLESWFDGKGSTYFAQDSTLGTFVGVPEEFGSIKAMNDHHFHYGYWLMGAAHVALRDPDWASQEKWGGMVGKIISDIATDERGRTDFPFLRNFDVYEGHSWASGDANFDAGNNQESSSEAVNAWAGLMLWGEATGDRRLRDLGAFLLTSEIASVNQYWFDLERQVLAPEYGKPFASMVFGGKYAYNTWWTQEPRQIFGINLLPITPASTYLGAKPEYVKSLVAALPADVKAYKARGLDDGTKADIWQDVIASYAALGDPEAGFALWNRKGSVEWGETRSRTLFWLSSLREMGTPDFSVTADTPLYAVFKDESGARTYLAYNARNSAIKVTFSTGQTIEVPPRSLVRVR
jgi:endoglucanase Acf2